MDDTAALVTTPVIPAEEATAAPADPQVAVLLAKAAALTAQLDVQATQYAAAAATAATVAADALASLRATHEADLQAQEKQHAVQLTSAVEAVKSTPTSPALTSPPPLSPRASLQRTGPLKHSLTQGGPGTPLGGSPRLSSRAPPNGRTGAAAVDDSVASLRAALETKDNLIASLQSRLEKHEAELHQSTSVAHRLQTQVDVINRQLRFGDDYRTLMKHLAAKCYVMHYRQWQQARDQQRQIEEVLKAVAARGEARARAAAAAAAAALTSAAPSAMNSPLQTSFPAGAGLVPPLIELGASPLSEARGAQTTALSPRHQDAAAAAGASQPTSPKISFAMPGPPPRQTFPTAVGNVLLGASTDPAAVAAMLAKSEADGSVVAAVAPLLNGRSTTISGSASLADVTEWLSASRAIWTAEKAAFARAAAARRERNLKLAFRMQEYAASASAAAVASGNGSNASRHDQRLLREGEKRRRAADEGPLRRTSNPFAHWTARRKQLLSEAPGLLALALEEFATREEVAQQTTKAWQQRNTQLLLDCASMQHEKSAVQAKMRAAQQKAAGMEAQLREAMEKVCPCARVASLLPPGIASSAVRCVCDCVEDCTCAQRVTVVSSKRASRKRLSIESEAGSNSAPGFVASLGALSSHFHTAMSAGASALTSPATKGRTIGPSDSLTSLAIEGAGGGGGDASGVLASPSTMVNSVPWLQRVVKSLRARLFAARDTIALLQREVETVRMQQSESNGSTSASVPVGTANHALGPLHPRGRGVKQQQKQASPAPPRSGKDGAASHRSSRSNLVHVAAAAAPGQQHGFGGRSARFAATHASELARAASNPESGSSSTMFPPLPSARFLASSNRHGASIASLASVGSGSPSSASATPLSAYPSAVPLSSSLRADLVAAVGEDLAAQLRQGNEARHFIEQYHTATTDTVRDAHGPPTQVQPKYDLTSEVTVPPAEQSPTTSAATDSRRSPAHRGGVQKNLARNPLSAEVRQMRAARAAERPPAATVAATSRSAGKKRTYVLHTSAAVIAEQPLPPPVLHVQPLPPAFPPQVEPTHAAAASAAIESDSHHEPVVATEADVAAGTAAWDTATEFVDPSSVYQRAAASASAAEAQANGQPQQAHAQPPEDDDDYADDLAEFA